MSESQDILYSYLEILISKLFKIIPMKEENVLTLPSYLKSLYKELWGAISTVRELDNNAEFFTVVHTVKFLSENDVCFEDCRKEILNCIRIIGKLKKNI